VRSGGRCRRPPEAVALGGEEVRARGLPAAGVLGQQLGQGDRVVLQPVGVLVVHIFWFDRRVREDEQRLAELFGEPYRDYCRRVKRWIPGLV